MLGVGNLTFLQVPKIKGNNLKNYSLISIFIFRHFLDYFIGNQSQSFINP